jgi:hypothetical protein
MADLPERSSPTRTERDLVAHLAGMPRYPGEEPLPEEHGSHVMGVTVHAWLAGEPLRRWGPEWLDGGSMSLRFRRHLEAGDPLTLVVLDEPDRSTYELRTPDDLLVASAEAGRPGPELADPGSFVDGPRPVPKLAPTAQALDGRSLGSMQFTFDPDLDLGLLERLDTDDPYRRLRVAHPAWVASGVNRLIAETVAMAEGRWTHAGTAVRSLRPIAEAATITLLGRVERVFEAKGHQFADVGALALADELPAMVFRFTIVYGGSVTTTV